MYCDVESSSGTSGARAKIVAYVTQAESYRSRVCQNKGNQTNTTKPLSSVEADLRKNDVPKVIDLLQEVGATTPSLLNNWEQFTA